MKKLSFLILSILMSCGGSESGGENTTPTPPSESTSVPPGSFTLTTPANGSVCIADRTHAWAAAPNATSYTFKTFDGTGALLYSKTQNETAITVPTTSLPDNTAYTWQVTAKNSAGETTSAVWASSTPGVATANYNPSILEMTIDAPNQRVFVKVKDQENEAMTYTLSASSDNDFSDDETLFSDENITDEVIDNDVDTREFYINDVPFSNNTLWLKIIIKDATGNQTPYTTSHN